MRIKVLELIFFLSITLVLVRLWYWQIYLSDFLVAKAEKQRISSIDVLAPRGLLLFSNGASLASTQPVFLVYAEPKIIKDKKEVASLLANIFWEDMYEIKTREDQPKNQKKALEKDILKKISQDLFWVSLGRKVNIETKQKIDKLNLSGIDFERSSSRFYPEGSSSAQLLGFVGSDIYGNETGYFGLEGYYSGELRGKEGILKQEKDAQGLPILIGDYFIRQPKEGKTLVLNIDQTVQYLIEKNLKIGYAKYGAKEASAVVMDPKTGNILGMSSYPSYDPSYPIEEFKDYFKNPLIADGYEPGSTFKVLVMAAAINEKVIKADTICTLCSGPIDLGGFTIRTWNNQYRPNSTMTDVIVHSDNTGMVFISQKLGLDKLYSYIHKFGFGELTNVDLQDEHSPPLRLKEEWREIDQATASFGQGIAVTAIQMIKAVSAIANEGKIMEPHVVKSIAEEDQNSLKKTFNIKPKQISQPISSEAAQIVKEMMVQAVDKGEAQFYKKKAGLSDFKIAGKTGTAQIPVAGHYDENKTIASFIGFAPADDPKFVILVRYREPSASIFGAETAAPTFFEIAKELFLYYGISPNP